MASDVNRREFLKHCSHAGVGCTLLLCPALSLADEDTAQTPSPEEIKAALNPENLTYCGYRCGEHCDLYRATQTNDSVLKRKAFDEQNWEKLYGTEFDPEKVFCYGCKNEEQPASVAMKFCTVRDCSIDRKLASCIQCQQLDKCEKDLWTRFPEHKEYVLKMQAMYVEVYEAELI